LNHRTANPQTSLRTPRLCGGFEIRQVCITEVKLVSGAPVGLKEAFSEVLAGVAVGLALLLLLLGE